MLVAGIVAVIKVFVWCCLWMFMEIISRHVSTKLLLLFAGRNLVRHYSTKRITAHYSVVPRETDPRWEGDC